VGGLKRNDRISIISCGSASAGERVERLQGHIEQLQRHRFDSAEDLDRLAHRQQPGANQVAREP